MTNEQGFCTGYFSKDVSSKDRTTYKIVQRGYFAYNPSRINVGSIDWQDCKEKVIVSPIYVVFGVDHKLNQRYLLHYLKSDIALTYIRASATGSVRDNLKFSALSEIPIKLLPMEQQEKIADTLDAVDNLISSYKKEIETLDTLVKSRFIEMFGDPLNNSMGWKMGCAENHIDLLSGFPFDSSKYTEKGVNICGRLIIMPDRIEWDDCKHLCSTDGLETYMLKANDIVMALDHPWILEGFKIAMIDEEHLPALLIQRTARIRAINVNQHYLLYRFILGDFDSHCSVTGSLVPHISAKDIRSFPIMLSPIGLQHQFSAFVQEVDKSKLAIQKSLDELETLKKALMQKYFS
ncbi:MAG: restriction endonuclease subunit S [Ruminococcus sp.]|nr:restriction endonuclease subunit S [Ruminococcus sp.]